MARTRPEVIIGQRRVIGLLTFLATPFLVLAGPGNVDVRFIVTSTLGVALLFLARFRTVGVGLLTGTLATLGVLLVMATRLAGVD